MDSAVNVFLCSYIVDPLVRVSSFKGKHNELTIFCFLQMIVHAITENRFLELREVQWKKDCVPHAVAWFQCLAVELRSCLLGSQIMIIIKKNLKIKKCLKRE